MCLYTTRIVYNSLWHTHRSQHGLMLCPVHDRVPFFIRIFHPGVWRGASLPACLRTWIQHSRRHTSLGLEVKRHSPYSCNEPEVSRGTVAEGTLFKYFLSSCWCDFHYLCAAFFVIFHSEHSSSLLEYCTVRLICKRVGSISFKSPCDMRIRRVYATFDTCTWIHFNRADVDSWDMGQHMGTTTRSLGLAIRHWLWNCYLERTGCPMDNRPPGKVIRMQSRIQRHMQKYGYPQHQFGRASYLPVRLLAVQKCPPVCCGAGATTCCLLKAVLRLPLGDASRRAGSSNVAMPPSLSDRCWKLKLKLTPLSGSPGPSSTGGESLTAGWSASFSSSRH